MVCQKTGFNSAKEVFFTISNKWLWIFRSSQNYVLQNVFRLIFPTFSLGMEKARILKVFLVLIAIHSACVGVGLVALPLRLFDFFGFQEYQGGFFKIQGGIFHLIMAFVYIQASRDPVKNANMIYLTIIAKTVATVFLLSYYFFLEKAWMVLISGIADLLMGLLILFLYLSVSRTVRE